MAGQNLARTMVICKMMITMVMIVGMRMKIMIKKSEGNIWAGTECPTMRAVSRRLGAPVKDLPMPGGSANLSIETERHGNLVIKIHRQSIVLHLFFQYGKSGHALCQMCRYTPDDQVHFLFFAPSLANLDPILFASL